MGLIKMIVRYIWRRITEFFYISFFRACHYIRGGYINNNEDNWSEFKADLTLLDPEKRESGVSGFYRVKNEEQFLRASVEAHLPHLDEIIIVYNDCYDKTPEIAKELEREHPDKIKVYEYKPEVFVIRSKEHVVTSAKSVHSIVNYYNYTLLKTTKKIVFKIDADHLPILPKFAEAVSEVRQKNITTMLYFYGVNLCLKDNEIFVDKKQPFTHGFDHGFFPVSRKTYFVHRKECESLRLSFKMYFTRKSLGVVFYHLRGLKVRKTYGALPLLSWEKAQKKYPAMLVDVPHPPRAYPFFQP